MAVEATSYDAARENFGRAEHELIIRLEEVWKHTSIYQFESVSLL